MHRTHLLAFALLGASTAASAQVFSPNSASASASVTATVLEPSGAGETEPIQGEVAPPAEAREVVVDPCAGSQPRAKGGQALRPATCKVTGRHGATLALALPSPDACVLQAPGATLAIKGFLVSVNGGPATDHPGGIVLDEGGHLVFKVGAAFELGPGQARSRYSGRFDMTLAYN